MSAVPSRLLPPLAALALLAACTAGEHAQRREQSAIQVLEAPLSEVWPHVRAFAQAEGMRIREDPKSHVLTTDWVEHFGGSKHAATWQRWAFIGRDGGPGRARVWVLFSTRTVNPALAPPGDDILWGRGRTSGQGTSGGRAVSLEDHSTNRGGALPQDLNPTEREGGRGPNQGLGYDTTGAAEDPNAIETVGDLGMSGDVQEGGRAYDVEEKLLAFVEPRLAAAREDAEAVRQAKAEGAAAAPSTPVTDAELQQAEAEVLRAEALRARCGEPVPGAERLLGPATVLVLGEAAHGTVEAPQFLERLACDAAARGVPVTAALELPVVLQPRLVAYLESDGGPGARAALLAHPYWKAPFPDGRSSRAVLGLVDALRGLRAAGLDVAVLAYDFPQLQGDARQQAMARRLLQVVEAAPGRATVVLSGNAHARRARGGPWGRDFEPMALRLSRVLPEVVSLDMAFAPGSAWTCSAPHGSPDAMVCGPVPMRASGAAGLGTRPFVYRFEGGPRDGFDGFYFLGPVRASPPASGPSGSGGAAPTAAR